MADPPLPTGPEILVLVHGLGLPRHAMWPLGRRIARPGTQVVNWGYPSLRGGIDQFADSLVDQLRQLDEEAAGPIHIVCHSLGCVVSRAALARFVPGHFSRWVMLTPPNRGSDACQALIGRLARRWIPAVDQLSSLPGSYVNRLPPRVTLDCGVIAARWDWLVPVAYTHIEGERDHIVAPTTHAGVLIRRDAARLARHFLDHGRFEADRSSRAA